MPTVKWNQIGSLNQQLVLDLRAGQKRSSNYPVDKAPPEGWFHSGFDYDVMGFGLYAYQNKRRLPNGWWGAKYYCFNANGAIDMKKRIVHIYKLGEGGVKSDHHFYRLIHTGGNPAAYDNNYSACEEIIDIDAT